MKAKLILTVVVAAATGFLATPKARADWPCRPVWQPRFVQPFCQPQFIQPVWQPPIQCYQPPVVVQFYRPPVVTTTTRVVWVSGPRYQTQPSCRNGRCSVRR